MVNKAFWQWYGGPGHLIVAAHCRFHLTTIVGNYVVSTIGQYLPDSEVQVLFANMRHNPLEGRGDEREYDYLKKFGFEDIGYNRKFETMVFYKSDKTCESDLCNCGMPFADHTRGELEMMGYNDARAANEGHLLMCEKYAEKDDE